jgi:hypothetical protein
MPKLFLTASDIDHHADRGVKEIPIDNNVVLTDIAREQARARGVRLVRVDNASPSITECHTTTADKKEPRCSRAGQGGCHRQSRIDT